VKENRTVVASGYFDPIHVGHIEYLEMAAKLGDKLIVIVNNDNQAALKKGTPFMTEGDRLKIVSSLKCVDEVFLSIDEDPTVCRSLQAVNPDIFAKGGDRFIDEIPEATICKEIGAEIVDGLGMKIRSSSDYYNKEE
jgi:rfaE bifunctional protein nucleotidyltransferase chain/domain